MLWGCVGACVFFFFIVGGASNIGRYQGGSPKNKEKFPVSHEFVSQPPTHGREPGGACSRGTDDPYADGNTGDGFSGRPAVVCVVVGTRAPAATTTDRPVQTTPRSVHALDSTGVQHDHPVGPAPTGTATRGSRPPGHPLSGLCASESAYASFSIRTLGHEFIEDVGGRSYVKKTEQRNHHEQKEACPPTRKQPSNTGTLFDPGLKKQNNKNSHALEMS